MPAERSGDLYADGHRQVVIGPDGEYIAMPVHGIHREYPDHQQFEQAVSTRRQHADRRGQRRHSLPGPVKQAAAVRTAHAASAARQAGAKVHGGGGGAGQGAADGRRLQRTGSGRRSFRRFDVQQWVDARDERRSEERQRTILATQPGSGGLDPAAGPQTPQKAAGYRPKRAGQLSGELATLGSKLDALGRKIGVGEVGGDDELSDDGSPRRVQPVEEQPAGRGGGKNGRRQLRERDELISALQEVVRTQGQQLLVREAEIADYTRQLAAGREDQETVGALVSALEEAEAELIGLEGRLAEQAGQTAAQEAEAALLHWQLSIAVPDQGLRRLLAQQVPAAAAACLPFAVPLVCSAEHL